MGTLLIFSTMYKGRESRERPPINYRIKKTYTLNNYGEAVQP